MRTSRSKAAFDPFVHPILHPSPIVPATRGKHTPIFSTSTSFSFLISNPTDRVNMATAEAQICPVVGATTDHHHILHKHPDVAIPEDKAPTDAAACPALQKVVKEPKSKEMDDEVCPVVGTATTVLPPDHPSTDGKSYDAECPVTMA